jgi:hypothetical protein
VHRLLLVLPVPLVNLDRPLELGLELQGGLLTLLELLVALVLLTLNDLDLLVLVERLLVLNERDGKFEQLDL